MHIIHDKNGMITALLVDQEADYGTALESVGHLFVPVRGRDHFPAPSKHYVDVNIKAKTETKDKKGNALHTIECIVPKTPFPAKCSKTKIKANGLIIIYIPDLFIFYITITNDRCYHPHSYCFASQSVKE